MTNMPVFSLSTLCELSEVVGSWNGQGTTRAKRLVDQAHSRALRSLREDGIALEGRTDCPTKNGPDDPAGRPRLLLPGMARLDHPGRRAGIPRGLVHHHERRPGDPA